MATPRSLLLLASCLFACGDAGSAGESASGSTEVGASTDTSTGAPTGTSEAAPTTGSTTASAPDLGPSGPPAVDYVIVAADPLVDAAQRFADYRAAGGHTVVLTGVGDIVAGETDPEAASEAIRAHIQGYYAVRDPDRAMFVLLVGDADGAAPVDGATIPTGVYSYTLQSAPEPQRVATDHRYADLDGDDLPELAVGRVPAASPAAVDAYLAKVVAAEAAAVVGPWNRRISLFAGSYGQGAIVDSLIEQLVDAVLDEVSYDFDITMTYAAQDSPYVYIPEKFSDQVYARINEGALLVSYLGHGSANSFDSLLWSGVPYPILDLGSLDQLAIAHRSPILTLIACAMGAFDAGESVSEKLLAHPGGPAAVLSSTELSDVYPNTIFVRELGLTITGERPATVGEAFVRAKQRVIDQKDGLRQQLDQLFGLSLPPADLETLRRSHLYMYTLFGDPGLALRYPLPATVTATPEKVGPGQPLAVTIAAPGLVDAALRVTLESQRSQIVHPLVPVPPDGDGGRDAAIAANYGAANDKAVVVVDTALVDGALATSLLVPADTPVGLYHVKVYADGGVDDAFGSVAVQVQ